METPNPENSSEGQSTRIREKLPDAYVVPRTKYGQHAVEQQNGNMTPEEIALKQYLGEIFPTPKRKDLVKLANDLFLVLSGKEADETLQRRFVAAVDASQALGRYQPRAMDALIGIMVYELADERLRSSAAKQAAYSVAETYLKRAGYVGEQK